MARYSFARLIQLVIFFAVPATVLAQPCADCAIAIPDLADTGTGDQELRFKATGKAGNCTDPAISPSWSVSGMASLTGPTNDSIVRVQSNGPFQLTLSYLNNQSGEPGICTMTSGVPVSPNPQWSASCGLNLILVLDESNSISYTQENLVRDAVTGLLESLTESGANVAIVEFGTRAEAEIMEACGIAGSPHYVEVTGETISGCLWDYLWTDYGITPSGGTNWDDALLKVRQVIDGNEIQPDLVLFVTDGNPTFYIDEFADNVLAGSGMQTAVSAVMHAVAQANAVKGTAPIFAVGIGNSVSMANLGLISGNRPFTGNVATSDYLSLQNFQVLAGNLQQVATALCAPSLELQPSWSPCIMAPDYRMSIAWLLRNTGSLDAAGTRLTITPPPGFSADSMICTVPGVTVREEAGQWLLEYGILPAGQQLEWIWYGRLAGPGEATFAAAAHAQDVPAQLQSVTMMPSTLQASVEVVSDACGERPDGFLELIISGGLPPYEVAWSTGQTATILEGVTMGHYSARVTDAGGCGLEASGEVGQAVLMPLYVPLQASSGELCPLGSVVLTGPDGFPEYQWFLDGRAIAQTDQPRWVATEPGDYTVFVEDATVCAAGMSEPQFIDEAYPIWEYDTIYLNFQAVFDGEGMPLCPAGSIGLHPEDWGSYTLQQTSGETDFSLDAGTFCLLPQTDLPSWQSDTLILEACESDGCASCARLVWIITQPGNPEGPEYPAGGQCQVPQVITPNGDGLNDYLVITCPDPAYLPEIQIYNRWGSEVYRSGQYQNDWQGTYRGVPLPEGTYYYSLVSGYREGRPVVAGGFITLVR